MTSSNKIYIECICGSSVLKCNISIHIKSKRHIRYVNNIKEYISDNNKSSYSDEEFFEMNKDKILDVCNGIRTSMTSTERHKKYLENPRNKEKHAQRMREYQKKIRQAYYKEKDVINTPQVV